MRYMPLIIATAAVAALGCGGDDGPSDPNDGGDGANTVTVSNNLFTPGQLTVPVGTTVTWQWNSGGTAHNVTFQDGIKSEDAKTSGTFPRTFSTAGAFPYQCTLHPGMNGNVIVTASTTGTGNGGTGGGGTGGGDYP